MSAHKHGRNAPPRVQAARTDGGTLAVRLTAAAQQAAVLALAVFGFLFCLITSYHLTVQTARAVWAAIALIVLFAAIYSSRRRKLLLLLCFLLFTLIEKLPGRDAKTQ